MATIEVGVRGAGIAVLLLLALIVWRDTRHALAARYYALFMLSGICYLVESAPGLMASEPHWLVPIRFLSDVSPALFQLWAWATFDDSFKPSWFTWLPTAAMAALTGYATLAHQWLPWRITQGAALLFVCAGVWHVLAGREADLVEGRRRFRLVLTVTVGLVIAGLTLHAAFATTAFRVQSGFLTASIVLGLGLASAVLQLGARMQPELALAPVSDAPPYR